MISALPSVVDRKKRTKIPPIGAKYSRNLRRPRGDVGSLRAPRGVGSFRLRDQNPPYCANLPDRPSFWRRRSARLNDPNPHTTPNKTNKQKIRNRRDATRWIRTPADQYIPTFTITTRHLMGSLHRLSFISTPGQPPAARSQNDMCRRTLQIRSKYEPAATPPDRYGSPRVGEVRLLRQESDIWRQSPPPVLHFRRRPTSRPHDPNGHVTPNATNKQEIRHRRNDSGPLRIPTDR